MSLLLYNIFLWVYRAGAWLGSLFDPKARKWREGRKNWSEKLAKDIGEPGSLIWIHCASLGEFEQGRPLMEALRQNFPNYRLLLTFFSPSGYEVQKKYTGADWVHYLPLDGPVTARKFLEITQPSLVIFVKYEFWFYYLKKISYRNIPLLLVSALFRSDMSFFKWHGRLQRKMLSRFRHIFVQNESSKQLLDEIGYGDITSVSGDTRFDRVIRIAEQSAPLAIIEAFRQNKKLIVAGSTWPEDEGILSGLMKKPEAGNLQLIIAPHEIPPKHITDLFALFPGAQLYSAWKQDQSSSVMIIDNVGMLSRIYRYADICYIGGGLRSSGIHNVLEAAVYGKPIVFGPHYEKYQEAVSLIKVKGALSFSNESQFHNIISNLMEEPNTIKMMGDNGAAYVRSSSGATTKIIRFIQENRLLTN